MSTLSAGLILRRAANISQLTSFRLSMYISRAERGVSFVIAHQRFQTVSLLSLLFPFLHYNAVTKNLKLSFTFVKLTVVKNPI